MRQVFLWPVRTKSQDTIRLSRNWHHGAIVFAFGAGFIAATSAALGRDQQVIETNVGIKTPDGVCDAIRRVVPIREC